MTQKYAKRTVLMHSQGHFQCRIPADEALTAMTDLSAGAYKLLIYYYSKSTGWSFVDKQIADTIGVTERRLKELRKELIEKRYLYIAKGDIDNYFIGRRQVSEWLNPDIAGE